MEEIPPFSFKEGCVVLLGATLCLSALFGLAVLLDYKRKEKRNVR
jgi:hypothetical protein